MPRHCVSLPLTALHIQNACSKNACLDMPASHVESEPTRFRQEPAPPPTTASLSIDRERAGARFERRLGGMRAATSPPVSLSRRTNGRVAVYRMTVTEQGST